MYFLHLAVFFWSMRGEKPQPSNLAKSLTALYNCRFDSTGTFKGEIENWSRIAAYQFLVDLFSHEHDSFLPLNSLQKWPPLKLHAENLDFSIPDSSPTTCSACDFSWADGHALVENEVVPLLTFRWAGRHSRHLPLPSCKIIDSPSSIRGGPKT